MYTPGHNRDYFDGPAGQLPGPMPSPGTSLKDLEERYQEAKASSLH